MKKTLGLLPVVLISALLPLLPSSPAGAAMPNANANDTCDGLKATITKPAGPETVDGKTYQLFVDSGTPGRDVIIGTDGPDHIIAGAGDTVCARGGDDLVELRLARTEPPADFSRPEVVVDLGYGNDRMVPRPSYDYGYGDASVYAVGGPGSDWIESAAGDDILDASDGGFSMAGGAGFDECTAYWTGSFGYGDDCELFNVDNIASKAYFPLYRKAPPTTTTSQPTTLTTVRTSTTTRPPVTPPPTQLPVTTTTR